MDWEDWVSSKFPPNGGSASFIHDEAHRIGEGAVIIGFQFKWYSGSRGDNLHRPYWCRWDMVREPDGKLRLRGAKNLTSPPSETFLSLFPLIYSRCTAGHIPLAAFTPEEWSALTEGGGDEGRVSGVLDE